MELFWADILLIILEVILLTAFTVFGAMLYRYCKLAQGDQPFWYTLVLNPGKSLLVVVAVRACLYFLVFAESVKVDPETFLSMEFELFTLFFSILAYFFLGILFVPHNKIHALILYIGWVFFIITTAPIFMPFLEANYTTSFVNNILYLGIFAIVTVTEGWRRLTKMLILKLGYDKSAL